jgi:hypothetical protein
MNIWTDLWPRETWTAPLTKLPLLLSSLYLSTSLLAWICNTDVDEADDSLRVCGSQTTMQALVDVESSLARQRN